MKPALTLLLSTLLATTIASQSLAAPSTGPAQERAFDTVDLDGNGWISEQEFNLAFRTPGKAFAELDANSDGRVEKGEARASYDGYKAAKGDAGAKDQKPARQKDVETDAGPSATSDDRADRIKAMKDRADRRSEKRERRKKAAAQAQVPDTPSVPAQPDVPTGPIIIDFPTLPDVFPFPIDGGAPDLNPDDMFDGIPPNFDWDDFIRQHPPYYGPGDDLCFVIGLC